MGFMDAVKGAVGGFASGGGLGAVVGGIGGLLLGGDDLKDADKYSGAAAGMSDRMRELADSLLTRADEQWNFYSDYGRPVDITIIEDAMRQYHQGARQDVALASADVNTAFDRAQAIRDRQQQRLGEARPDAQMADQRQMAIERARKEVDARNVARRQSEQENFSRLIGASGIGDRAIRTASNLTDSGSRLFGNAQTGYESAAQRHADSAAGIAGWVSDVAARVPWQDIPGMPGSQPSVTEQVTEEGRGSGAYEAIRTGGM